MPQTLDQAEPVIDLRDQRVPHIVPTVSAIGNPMPVALGLLAMQLFLFGVEWYNTTPGTLGKSTAATANEYALLVAGLAQVLAGVLCLIRGEGYRGQVATMFGLWLLGFFLLARDEKAGPAAASWFLFAIVVPIVVMMVPAILSRIWPFIIAFGSIVLMALFAGFGFRGIGQQLVKAAAGGRPELDTYINLLHVAAVLAWICVIALIWTMVEDLFREHGVLRAREH